MFFISIYILLSSLPSFAAYNFGVVVKNENYQIYRSSALGRKGLLYLKTYLKNKKLPYPKTIIYMNHHGYYNGGFATQEIALQRTFGYTFYHSKGAPSTYLEGHDPRSPKKDVTGDGVKDGDVEAFYRIMELVLDRENQPVLFHCLGGRHRTGMIAMAIRTIQGGHWVNGPKRRRAVFPRIRSPYLSPLEQEYASFNTALFRFTNVRFIRDISKDDKFQEWIEFYRDDLHVLKKESIYDPQRDTQKDPWSE